MHDHRHDYFRQFRQGPTRRFRPPRLTGGAVGAGGRGKRIFCHLATDFTAANVTTTG